MNLQLDGCFCTHNSSYSCANSLSKTALQVGEEGELAGRLRGLLVCIVVAHDQSF